VPPGFGQPPGWRTQVFAPSRNYQQIRAPSSTHAEQFPSLSGSTPSARPSNLSNGVWGQKSNSELFKPGAKPKETPKPVQFKVRQPVQPPISVWTDAMQEDLRKRELGLPDSIEEQLEKEAKLELEKAERRKQERKIKKLQQKSVTPAQAAESAKRSEHGLVPSATRFETLADYDKTSARTKTTHEKVREPDHPDSDAERMPKEPEVEKDKAERQTLRISSRPTLTPTTDGFVRITMAGEEGSRITLASIANAISSGQDGAMADGRKAEVVTSSRKVETTDGEPTESSNSVVSNLLSSLFSLPKKN